MAASLAAPVGIPLSATSPRKRSKAAGVELGLESGDAAILGQPRRARDDQPAPAGERLTQPLARGLRREVAELGERLVLLFEARGLLTLRRHRADDTAASLPGAAASFGIDKE